MPRKTISVEEVKAVVNKLLSYDDPYIKCPGKDRNLTTEEALRMGAAEILEFVLEKTGNYHGFGYQNGQMIFTDGMEYPTVIDETRRVYY
jgi:hypothetical protein